MSSRRERGHHVPLSVASGPGLGTASDGGIEPQTAEVTASTVAPPDTAVAGSAGGRSGSTAVAERAPAVAGQALVGGPSAQARGDDRARRWVAAPRWLATRVAAMSGPARYVAVLAVLSGVAAVVIRHTVFPFLSVNNDEGVYLLHAQTLAEGRLFPPAPHPAGSYLPWLGTVVDDHYVLKYTPFVPAVYALALLVSGSIDPALAMIVGLAVVVTFLLGVEVSGSRRIAALAATLLALSPLVILQSAMVLSYLPALLLLQLTVLGVLRGRRRGRRGPLVVAGLALGVAAAIRPYDVVLLLAPLAVWLMVASPGRRWWLCRWLLCGLAAPVMIVLLTNAAATGSPFRLPFGLLEHDDRLGFGIRRLYPGDGAHDFGLDDGLRSVGDHLWLLGGWACGGVVLAGCTLVAAVRRRLSAPAAVLGAGGLLFLVGYIGFWGAWNAAELWGGIRYIGPFYLVPVLIPLVHLGAGGMVTTAEWVLARGRRLGRGVVATVVAAVLGLTAFVLVGAVGDNLRLTSHDRALRAMIHRLPGRPVVFVAANPPFLGHPTPVVANRPEMNGATLFAVARGVDDLTVAADHPGRPTYLLRLAAAYDRSPGSSSAARLERLVVRSGKRFTATVQADAAPARSRGARLVFTAGNRSLSVPVNPRAPVQVRLTVDGGVLDAADVTDISGTAGASGAGSVDGRLPRSATEPGFVGTVRTSSVRAGRGTSVTVAYFATSASGHEHFVDRQILPVRLAGSPGSRQAIGSPVTVLGSTGEVDEVGMGRQPPLRITLDDQTAPAARRT